MPVDTDLDVTEKAEETYELKIQNYMDRRGFFPRFLYFTAPLWKSFPFPFSVFLHISSVGQVWV